MKKMIFLMFFVMIMITVSLCCAQDGMVISNLPKIDNTAWQYNADDDVYYQLGITYCETPADEKYENLAVFVPGAFFTGTENGDGTYTPDLSDNSQKRLSEPCQM